MLIPIADTISNEKTFLTSDFDEYVLFEPAMINQKTEPCDSLKIITAYTDCERISTHMIQLAERMRKNNLVKGINVEIILGMTKCLSVKKHEDIKRILGFINQEKGMPRVSFRYVCKGSEVHSKVYIWGFSNDKRSNEYLPLKAYCGSVNYTMNAFYKRRESLSQCNALLAHTYYKELFSDTIDCFDPLAKEQIKAITNNEVDNLEKRDDSESEYIRYDMKKPMGEIYISLLKADGSDTGYGSGINWGIRRNKIKRNPNQAYIPYNNNDKVYGFFPDRNSKDEENCPMFKVITKDFGAFHMRMAQQGNKAIHSVESNAILGEWIRKKLGIASGGYITKQMLENYGKTYVTFRKYNDGVYLLDF